MWALNKHKDSDYWTRKGAEIEEAARAAAAGAQLVVSEQNGVRIARYERDGRPDYEAYRRVQSEGNRLKLQHVFTNGRMIRQIARHARRRVSGGVHSVLCHGSRNGAELRWFAEQFPNAEVLGTDIAETASQFPNTIQWDFHDIRDDWRGKWNVVYTNSWDHAMEPERAFRAWAESLAPGGILYLEHGSGHDVDGTNALDLFGASRAKLRDMVVEATGLKPLMTVGLLSKTRKALPFRREA
ncbi:class I SAM-dependent methyltransferase [Hyphomonas sp.]|uniref:class I SAM-dependent methyltransferase n=1 Tax=Hyphomonas sp. TaxID=87 RepID=UPI0025C30FEF|nr:class I SAM-dependent methyltransferase [Hyphomonas sp.]